MFNIDTNTVEQEKKGVWKDYKGSKFLIAHTNNPGFQKLYSRLQLPHRKAIDKGRLDPDISLDIIVKSLSKHVLLDWKDVVDNSGNSVPYSIESAEKVLRTNTEFREFVTEVSTDIGQFVEEERKELGESAGTSLNGS